MPVKVFDMHVPGKRCVFFIGFDIILLSEATINFELMITDL